MRKGISIVVTATDSGRTRSFFIAHTWFKYIVVGAAVLVALLVLAIVTYSRVYYQAAETTLLRQRIAEMDEAFSKIQQIEENLNTAEMRNQQLKVMLGVEKTPPPIEPIVQETTKARAEPPEAAAQSEKNIPSLLPTRGEISRNFDPEHQGIDIAAPRLSPVVAAGSGIIEETGWDTIYGNYVIIHHDVNYATFYGHLHSIDVKRNDRVVGGQVIGTVGSTGRSTSPHVHYEVRFRDKPVEPLGYVTFIKQ